MPISFKAAEGLAVGDAVVVSLVEPSHLIGEVVTGTVANVQSDGSVDVRYEGLVDGRGFGNHEPRDIRKLDAMTDEELDIAAAKPKVAPREQLQRGQPPRLGEAGEKRMAEVKKAGKFEWAPGKAPDVFSKNEKLLQDRIASWGIPAYMTPKMDAEGNIELDKDGNPKWTTICKNAGQCALNYDCYALNGPMAFPGARLGSYQYRYLMTLQPEFVQKMDAYVKVRKAEGDKAVRVHDAGDFYSLKYLKDWYKVAELNPDMKFYAYTKMVSMAKSTEGEKPKNWRWIYSFGGTQDNLIKEDDFHSFPFDSLEDLQANGYADASESDAAAAYGNNNKIGLVVHNPNKGDSNKGSWHTYAPSWLKPYFDKKAAEKKTAEPVKEAKKEPAAATKPTDKPEELPAVEAGLKADYGIGFANPASVERTFGKARERAEWAVQNDKMKMEKAGLRVKITEDGEVEKRGVLIGSYSEGAANITAFTFYFTVTKDGVQFDDESVDYYPEYAKKMRDFVVDHAFGNSAETRQKVEQAQQGRAIKNAEDEVRKALGNGGPSEGRRVAQRRGVNGAAPYTAPAENPGTAYKNSDKFFQREGLYNGKGAPKTLDPNDLTKPGAKAMPVKGPQKVNAELLFAEAGDVTVSFKVYENTKTPDDDVVQVWMKPEHADAVEMVLQQAGFERVSPNEGVFDRPGRDLKEAMQAFEGAVAVAGTVEIVHRGQNVLTLAPVKAPAPVAAAYGQPISDKTFPVLAQPGNLPMFYRDHDGATLCPACATAQDWAGAKVVAADVNWEDDKLVCANCETRVLSAFAEAPEAVPTKLLAKMERKGAQGFVAQAVKAATLELWKTPRDYAGAEYPDYYMAFGQSRDSEVLERANFDAALEKLGGEHSSPEWEKAHPELEAEGKEEVMVARASHWAVGWVESILVHKDSAMVPVLQEMMDAYEEYPVVDEDLLSEYEMKQQDQDFESWGAEAVFEAAQGVEGVPEAQGLADLPQELQLALTEAFYTAWGNGGGDISSDDLAADAAKAAEAWVKSGPTRDRKELEKAGQQSLPGIKKKFGANLARKAARLYMDLHAADTWGGEDEEKAKEQPTGATEKGRIVRVTVPAGQMDALKTYLVDTLGTAYDVADPNADPLVVDVTFFPGENGKSQDEEEFFQFINSLKGAKAQYLRGRSNKQPTMGVKTDAFTFASLVHAAVMTTEPQGNEVEASVQLSIAAGVGTKLVLKQTRYGLVAEFGRRRKTVTASITPQALAAWAKEN